MGIYIENMWGFSYRRVVIPEDSHLQAQWEASNDNFAKADTQFDCLQDSQTRDSEILTRHSRDSLAFFQPGGWIGSISFALCPWCGLPPTCDQSVFQNMH